MLLIGALATMSAAANRFCVRSLHKIDAINAMVTQQVEPARLTLTEAKIAVEALGLATYKMAGTNDPDTLREANDERAGQYAAAKAWLRGVENYLPTYQTDVDGMRTRLDLISNIAESVYVSTTAGDRERARWTQLHHSGVAVGHFKEARNDKNGNANEKLRMRAGNENETRNDSGAQGNGRT